MADPREIFPILDDGTGSGSAPDQIVSGEAIGSQKGLLTFGFRDSTGNAVIPQLTSDGKLPVSTQSPGTCKRARGSVAGAVGPSNIVTVATLTLAASKNYASFSVIVSCRQGAFFQLVWNNNGVETVLLDMVTGPGQFTVDVSEASCLEFQAGATGTQELLLKGYNFDKVSDLRGSFACLERT